MNFESLESAGTPKKGGRNLGVYLYPNEPGDRETARDPIRSAIDTACTQLLDHDALDHYEIELYTGETEVSYVEGEDDGETYFHNFNSWVTDNAGSRRGVHLGVTSHTNFANAEYVAKGETAWVANTTAFVGTAGGYDGTSEDRERYRNLAVQEPLHNIICPEYDVVDSLLEGDEHDLGMIASTGSDSGPSTPMLTFYERSDTHPTRDHDRTGRGACENGQLTWDGTHTLRLTSCTVAAVERTANNETAGQ